MRPFPDWLRFRALLFGAAFGFAVGQRCSDASVPERDLQEVAQFLGLGSDVQVAADSIRWEPSRGLLGDAFLGRRVLFVGQALHAAQRDVYRARVRTSPEGHALEVLASENLTETPFGDEIGLRVSGHLAAYVAFAGNVVQGITVLDLDGARASDLPGNFFNRLLLRVRAVQETDSLLGVSRTHVHLSPSESLSMAWQGSTLVATLDEGHQLRYDARARTATGDPGTWVVPQPLGTDHWLHTLADLLREELGSSAVFRLATWAFEVSDDVNRAIEPEATELAPRVPVEAPTPADSVWPPSAVSALIEPALPGEGVWQVSEMAAADADSRGQPMFYSTFLRPDPERPYVSLRLVAMDMRRLELRMEGGYEDPRPSTGLPGRGSLPDDPQLVRRVRATFNGAFKSLHGDYGMVVDRRVLVPPRPGAATVVLTDQGATGFGIWPETDVLPKNVVSLRQNLDPLIAGGMTNPTRRTQWGEHHLAEGVLTERSALCLAQSGSVYYAWGNALSASTLAKGLERAGCRFAMHLDMNPRHCGFFLHEAPEGKLDTIRAEPAFPGIEMGPTRFARWSSKDFFYVLLRDVVTDTPWTSSPGSQPEPDWLPAITTQRRSVGSLPLDVVRLQGGRLQYAVLAGTQEPMLNGRPAPVRTLPEQERALFALNLGHTTTATRYGLAFHSEATLPSRRDTPTLILGGTAPRIAFPEDSQVLAEGESSVQLPALMRDGALSDRGSERGSLRERAALCIDHEGSLLVAFTRHDASDVLALTLREFGCQSALELDRGSQHAAFFHRAGTNEPPQPSYPTTVLVGTEQPLEPKTYEWTDGP